MFQQKQLDLYKKEGYSIWGSCLPMIVTIVVFFIIFAGFNSMASYRVQMDYYEIATVYENKVDEMIASDSTLTDESEEVIAAAEQAVLDYYGEHRHKWLWVGNVFMGDNWSPIFPSYEEFTNQGMGGLGISRDWVGTMTDNYDKYTMVIRNHPDYQGWNGYLIMPVLTVLVTLGSQLLMRQMTPPTVDSGSASATSQNAVMKFMMPAMMGIFALFYSSAFTIYLLVSQLFSLIFSLVFNFITDRKDKKEDEYLLAHTFKRK
jgi:membrane protein insertase Oxa1/YidC/SpoIIIJ